MQRITDEPLTVCENCGGKLEKQWSLSGFQFKGAGWYVTDYAGKNPGAVKSEKSEKSSPAESTAKTETASNTKSDGAGSSTAETSSKKD
jgi:predicted nucleic acid-binding Zn ribbon protein